MFENCNSLAELNKERKELVRAGASQLEVNSAYNKARSALMSRTPSYRTIPSYPLRDIQPEVSVPLPLKAGVPNEITIAPEGVYL